MSPPEKYALSRERSYSDVNNLQPIQALLRQRIPSGFSDKSGGNGSIAGSDENCSLDETDLEIVQCFLPTGMVYDINVHPDDEIYQIKQIVLNNATADGKFNIHF